MILENLIKEAKNGNATAEFALYQRLSQNMLALCLRYVERLDEAQDRLQNGFIKFFSSLATFEFVDESSVDKWVSTIMTNECKDYLRLKNKLHLVPNMKDDDLVLDEQAFGKLSEDEIHRMIQQLPTGYRTVFYLYEVDGYDHKEIAELLGIAEKSSASQLARAKSHLQRMIIKLNDYANRKQQ